MIRIRVVGSILLAAGVLLNSSGAAEPASTIATANSIDERYFQREAANYQKFESDGETVYCTSARTSNEALIPHIGYVRCISELDLRRVVRDWRRDRGVTRG